MPPVNNRKKKSEKTLEELQREYYQKGIAHFDQQANLVEQVNQFYKLAKGALDGNFEPSLRDLLKNFGENGIG